MYNLAVLYHNQGKIAEAEIYYLKAIDKESVDALNNLAILYSDHGKTLEAEIYYLKAIKKGLVDALFNLAILYKDQGKISETEKYYLKAIEKGHESALNNLALLYYQIRQKPKEALEYARTYFSQTKNEIRFRNLVIFEIWNGIFDNIIEKTERVLQTSRGEGLNWFLENLLYLEQTQLVLSLFESPEHGKILRERYELIYYATLILAQKTEDNLLLKIPPEVMPTVQEIVEKVKEKQVFYAGEGS